MGSLRGLSDHVDARSRGSDSPVECPMQICYTSGLIFASVSDRSRRLASGQGAVQGKGRLCVAAI